MAMGSRWAAGETCGRARHPIYEWPKDNTRIACQRLWVYGAPNGSRRVSKVRRWMVNGREGEGIGGRNTERTSNLGRRLTLGWMDEDVKAGTGGRQRCGMRLFDPGGG